MMLSELNAMADTEAAILIAQCCAASNWVSRVVAERPYDNVNALLTAADKYWQAMNEEDWLEAFSAHPQIGNVATLREKYASTKALAAGEQLSVSAADDETLSALAAGNTEYLKKNGFIFIVCATGKSAAEMLAMLEARLPNDRETELHNGATEQHKITLLRLQKMFADESL